MSKRLCLAALAACILSACQQNTRPTVSLEEAKQVTAQFEGSSFKMPPRTIDDLKSLLVAETTRKQKCESELIPLQEFQQIVLNTSHNYSSIKNPEWATAQRFHNLAHAEYMNGYIDRAIALVEMSEGTYPHNWVGAHSILANLQAKYHAHGGNLEAASDAAGAGGFTRTAYHEAVRLDAQAAVAALEGRFADAEQNLRLLENHDYGRTGRTYVVRARLAQNLADQGRLQEAELVIREVALQPAARVSTTVRGRILLVLSNILFEQGRYDEAEIVGTGAVATYIAGQTGCSSIFLNLARRSIARAQLAQGLADKAVEQYETIRKEMATEPKIFEARFGGDVDWAVALLRTGQTAQAVRLLETAVEQKRARFGSDAYATVEAASLLAAARYLSGQPLQAFDGFKGAASILLDANETGGESRTARDERLVWTLEKYLALLSDMADGKVAAPAGFDLAAEAFRVADAARGRSVQSAVSSSSARAAASEPELGALIRREQDAQRHLDVLHRSMIISQGRGDSTQARAAVASIKAQIVRLRASRNTILAEIARRFPRYVEFINPKPPTAARALAALGAEEALLSFYVLEDRTLVWAVRPGQPVAFASAPLGHKALALSAGKLRRALEPSVDTVGDIPDFDLATAHTLYQSLLAPVESGWKSAKRLIVASHGPLATIPLAVLVTRSSERSDKESVLFSGYRAVPWLANEVAISEIPSVGSLVTLRELARVRSAGQPLVAFGDPWFTAEQKQDSGQTRTFDRRGVTLALRSVPLTRRLSSAGINALPPLPDTREEVENIAKALGANPATSVFVGSEASESRVKSMPLADRRVVVFATHGLVAGDLDGLQQPALALSSPAVTQDQSQDGLLTMSEIFGLKLDADWVVLSACNTAAAEGKGAQAISGLGRAFFYAGARALLVTHWPVETTSARALTTAIFELAARNRGIARAEALRQAMTAMIANGTFNDESGQAVFSYAHPIFWAPFVVVGDGA